MNPPNPHSQLYNQKPLSVFKTLFSGLPIPEIQSLRGVYKGEFTGPGWLRIAAGPSLALAGMGGWCGKDLQADRTGINLILRKGQYIRRFPMRIVNLPSLIDGEVGVTVTYTHDCPFPWPYIIDELRQIDTSTLLGMTIVNVKLLNNLAFPFLLFKTS